MNIIDYEDSLFVDSSIIIPDNPVDQLYLIKSRYEQFAQAINARQIAIYDKSEFETGQRWFTEGNPREFRQGFRKVIAIPDLAAGPSTVTVPHEIEDMTEPTNWWGKAYDSAASEWYLIPYSDESGTGNVSIKISLTSVTISSGATAPALSQIYVVLEYLKE